MGGMKTILIVGKDDRRRTMLENFLSFEGFQEVATTDLTDAIEISRTGKVDLILWDARMPLRGHAVLRRDLESAGISVPVITLDTAGTLKPFDPEFAVDFDECIVDPLDTRTLAAIIRNSLSVRTPQLPLAS